ncbi:MAG: LysM domain-containing protein [Actinomycetota bacterium]
MWLWALCSVAAPVLAVSCGSDHVATGSLPPIVTTSTTTSTLVVTTTTTPKYYKVQHGDTLGKIAKSFGVDSKELMALNGITNADHIEAGQVLRIPPPKHVVDTLPSTTTTTSVPPTTGG